MQLVIISGRSGSGKSSALDLLEDEGYYCIDNLPVSLLPALMEQLRNGSISNYRKVAICIDARNAGQDLKRFSGLLRDTPEGIDTEVVYLDADDATLIKRFSETRRRHPLSDAHTALAEAIRRERELLEPIAALAQLTLDTSAMNVHELRGTIKERLVGRQSSGLSLQIMSFGFKR
ncbi:MAG TPA: RNase adapter RapZ, partial [Spongiibacteraceae bacterium]|nr:RNase adapter RapZ [Spongiibacteraceae bacterium]